MTPAAETCRIEAIPTPFLLVHPERVRRNIRRLADYAQAHQLRVRPHIKTHKSLAVWQLQAGAGAVGVTTAKPGEAELFSAAADDILLAYPVVTADKARRLAELAVRGKTVRVASDSSLALEMLAAAARERGVTLGILVDVDVGHHRTGVATATEAADLARTAAETPGLRFDGIFCFPGQIVGSVAEQVPQIAAWSAQLAECLERIRDLGLKAEIVSGGSTPTAYQSHLNPHLTEIRPGTYVYNDANCLHGGYCTLEDCAARVVATVVSNAVAGQVVLDAGTKSLTSDRNFPRPDSGHGLVVEYPEALIRGLNEEHAMVDVTRCSRRPRLGERVSIVPNHICPCVNLHDGFWWQADEERAYRLPVDARGRVS